MRPRATSSSYSVMLFVSFALFLGDKQNKKPSVPSFGTEGAKSAVPPLVRPLLTERASGSSNKLRRGNGRIRPALLGNPFRGLLRGVFSQRSLPLSPAGGSLRRGDCDTFPHRRNSSDYDSIPLGACQPPYRATSRIRESKIKIPDSSIKLRLLCLLTE